LVTRVSQPFVESLVKLSSETVANQHIQGQDHDHVDNGDHRCGHRCDPGGVAETGLPAHPSHDATSR
jgi:hypothetical protein